MDDFCFIDTNYRDTLHRAEPGQIVTEQIASDDVKHDESPSTDSQSGTGSDDFEPGATDSEGDTPHVDHRHSVSQPLISITNPSNNRLHSNRLHRLHSIHSVHRQDTASDIWRALCGTANLSGSVPFDTLYPVLCKVFVEISGCSRMPLQSHLRPFALKNGGDCLQWKEWQRFWPWFTECCQIIKELSFLWDCSNSNLFLCNLFCGRTESKHILEKLDSDKRIGTFIVRLASIRGGVVISYFEGDSNGRRKKMKHVLITRKGPNRYQKKRGPQQHLTSLSCIIRSSDRIHTLYTPKGLYPKKTVF